MHQVCTIKQSVLSHFRLSCKVIMRLDRKYCKEVGVAK
jgi:hypothetical protein